MEYNVNKGEVIDFYFGSTDARHAERLSMYVAKEDFSLLGRFLSFASWRNVFVDYEDGISIIKHDAFPRNGDTGLPEPNNARYDAWTNSPADDYIRGFLIFLEMSGYIERVELVNHHIYLGRCGELQVRYDES